MHAAAQHTYLAWATPRRRRWRLRVTHYKAPRASPLDDETYT